MQKVKLVKSKSHQKYVGPNGENYPGVTTILGVINKPQLMHWAWEQGKAGLDFRKTAGQAADIGTITHFLCECYLKNEEADLSDFSPNDILIANGAFNKFRGWWDTNKFTYLESELQLASNEHKYGGTIDCVAKDANGNVTLIDFKTSKGIYDEYVIQLEAYSRMLIEVKGFNVSRKIIVRIGKEKEGDFEVREYGELPKHWRTFKACIELYYAKKDL